MRPSTSLCAATPAPRVLLGLLGARPPVQHGLSLMARPRFVATLAAPALMAPWRPAAPVPVPGPSRQHSRQSSSSSSSSSSSNSYPVWGLAAALPFVTSSAYDEITYPQQTVQIEGVPSSTSRSGTQLPLNEEVVRQISKGSITGFVLGLLVSTFSRSLVLFLGLAISVQSLAARVGIDLVQMLHLKERVQASKILSALSENTALKLSFAVAFTLSAFMRF